jgi:hypothetical protein
MHGEQNGADAHLLLITRASCSEGLETSNTTKSLIAIRSACMRGCFASSGVSETKAWMAPASFLPRFRLGRRLGLAQSERPRRARRPRTPASGRARRRRRSCALSAPGAKVRQCLCAMNSGRKSAGSGASPVRLVGLSSWGWTPRSRCSFCKRGEVEQTGIRAWSGRLESGRCRPG